ncbi:MFS transporter [Pseudonocardia hierapolitana]|uniref:MFS transporter n=1 Tax=Pseudonocardia hierapolitana TaxID=1128676 RepID=A0A561SHZ7_9PSEU|nr:MFS transporter [Pseudonocardia hierapolitana]TWF74473.1 MFS transporter [Pseudonocardia hierapolitana]
MDRTSEAVPGTWRELLGPRYVPVATVLAGGVLLEASNVYLTTSLLPTIVADIGGAEFYSWTMTTFLVASVITSMLVSRTLMARGAVAAYVLAFGLFAAGSLISAASPVMAGLLIGRAVQGLGGGLLAGLGYAMIQRALPERLWARAAALVSAMWGVGNILGPTVGGLFGQLDAWRAAFVVLVVVSGLLILLVSRAIPATGRTKVEAPVPAGSLALLTASVAAVSLASVVPAGAATAIALAVGVGLGGWFLRHERTARVRVLPEVTYRGRSRLRWVYVSVGVLAFGIGTEAFIPLFGQELGGMAPLAAGFLGAALSLGWSVTQMVTANATRPRVVRALIVGGPLLLAAGLAGYAVAQRELPGGGVIAVWVVALFAAGAGIGLAFPHLTVAAMGSSDDEEEAAKASAGINTVFIIANAFSAALAGVLVNLGAPSLVTSAHYLLFGFAAVVVLGVAPARLAARAVPSATSTPV